LGPWHVHARVVSSGETIWEERGRTTNEDEQGAFWIVDPTDTASSTVRSGVSKAPPFESVTGPAITVQTPLNS
jgi:hypothetical protein